MTYSTKRAAFGLLIGLALLTGCVPLPPETATPEPEAAAVVVAVEPTATLAPTETLAPTATTQPTEVPPTATLAPTETSAPVAAVAAANTATSVPTVRPTSTRRPTATATQRPRPTATATQDRSRIIITEADIEKAVTGGTAGQQGLVTDNLQVNFADGKINITADQLSYGIVRVANLNLVGRLTAQNGVLNLQVESISPRGLATSFIPTVANQALAQYGSKWYIENVTVEDGRVVLKVR